MIAGGIEYQSTGDGDAVVCLHGIGGGIDDYQAQLNGLPGHRVIAWAMPGYGASAPQEWPPSFASISSALGKFLAALNIDHAHIVGHSIGGMLAMDYALRQPDQVATLTLIGTTPAFGGKDSSFKDAFLKERLAPLEQGLSMAELANLSTPNLVGPNTQDAIIQDIARTFAQTSEHTWRGILECLVTFDRRNDLPQITQPCCLIAGAHDTNAPAGTMERMARKLSNAEYHLIESAGHMIPQEAPDDVNAILADFLKRHAS